MRPLINIWQLDDRKASVLVSQLFDRIEKLELDLKDLKNQKQPSRLVGHKDGVIEQFHRAQFEMTHSH